MQIPVVAMRWLPAIRALTTAPAAALAAPPGTLPVTAIAITDPEDGAFRAGR